MKRILITGGNGYIGRYLVNFFKSLQYEVYFTSRQQSSLPGALTMDLADEKTIHHICAGMDIVIHTANLDERLVREYGKEALLVNTYGTRQLYLDAVTNNVERFIYFSTFHIYGKTNGEIDENTKPQPISDYGMTHYFSEKYLEQLSNGAKTKVDIIRLTNGIGLPIGVDKWYLVVNDFCRTIYHTGEIILKSNGLPLRDFIAIKDVVSAVDIILNANTKRNLDIYNVSGEITYSIREVAFKVKEIYLKRYHKKVIIDIPLVTKAQITSVIPLFVSSAKLRKLGWTTMCHLEDVINEIFDYLEQTGR